jgi:hypothetical protein
MFRISPTMCICVCQGTCNFSKDVAYKTLPRRTLKGQHPREDCGRRAEMSGRITNYVIQYSRVIEIGDSVFFGALDLAQDLEDKHQFFISGKSSSGLAASVIYLASIVENEIIFQKDLSKILCEEICVVSIPTIQKLSKEITEQLKLQHDLRRRHTHSKVHNEPQRTLDQNLRPKANCGNFGKDFYEKGNESCESCNLRVQCKRKFISLYGRGKLEAEKT